VDRAADAEEEGCDDDREAAVPEHSGSSGGVGPAANGDDYHRTDGILNEVDKVAKMKSVVASPGLEQPNEIQGQAASSDGKSSYQRSSRDRVARFDEKAKRTYGRDEESHADTEQSATGAVKAVIGAALPFFVKLTGLTHADAIEKVVDGTGNESRVGGNDASEHLNDTEDEKSSSGENYRVIIIMVVSMMVGHRYSPPSQD